MSAPSAQQIEARYAQWWWQVGSGLPPEASEERSEHMNRVAREAFQAGAAYVISHAGLNEKVKSAEKIGAGENA